MASYYVRSGAGGAGTGDDWANAYTTLTLALVTKAAGDIFYIAADHSESTAGAVTLTSPGTPANPCFFYCAIHTGSVPPVSADLRATAQIATSSNNSITMAGSWIIHGVIFVAGNAAGSPTLTVGSTSGGSVTATECAFRLGSTGGGSIAVSSATAPNYVEWNNCTVQFAATGQTITVAGTLVWRKTASAVTGATFPTSLFIFTSTRSARLKVSGVDLSALGAGKTLVTATAATGISAVFMDCKLNASVTKSSTPTYSGAIDLFFIRCESGGNNYEFTHPEYAGTQIIETTIVRTGGASDGTTPIAWKIDTTANSRWAMPFECAPIAIWNDVDGSAVTVTVEGIWGGGAVPNNDEIWIEAQYLGDNASPQASFAHGTKADNLAAGTALAASSETWGGSTTDFKMTATFTPQQKGIVYVTVKAAKASSTFYVDPKITLS